MISAFGNTAVPSFRRRPLMWSPWKWLITTAFTWAGSKPAARKFAIQWPEVGAPISPLPASIMVTRPFWRRTRVVKEIGRASVGRKASCMAC
jgi:hypothetical protein